VARKRKTLPAQRRRQLVANKALMKAALRPPTTTTTSSVRSTTTSSPLPAADLRAKSITERHSPAYLLSTTYIHSHQQLDVRTLTVV